MLTTPPSYVEQFAPKSANWLLSILVGN